MDAVKRIRGQAKSLANSYCNAFRLISDLGSLSYHHQSLMILLFIHNLLSILRPGIDLIWIEVNCSISLYVLSSILLCIKDQYLQCLAVETSNFSSARLCPQLPTNTRKYYWHCQCSIKNSTRGSKAKIHPILVWHICARG